MENKITQHTYKLTTEVYSLEEYADLMDMTVEETLEYEHGMCVGCINAVLEDETTGYAFRLVRSLYATHYLAIAEATTSATLAILEDYFTHLRNIGRA